MFNDFFFVRKANLLSKKETAIQISDLNIHKKKKNGLFSVLESDIDGYGLMNDRFKTKFK